MIAVALLLAVVGIAALALMPRIEAQVMAAVPEPAPGTVVPDWFYFAVAVVAAVVVVGVLYAVARARGER